MKTIKRQYTPEFEIEAVKLWESGGRRSIEIGGQSGINPQLLPKWKRALERRKTDPTRCPTTQAPGPPFDAGADLAAEIARLRRENARPKMECEIRGQNTELKYERGVQPAPRLGEWVAVLNEILGGEVKLPLRERHSTQRPFEESRGRGFLRKRSCR